MGVASSEREILTHNELSGKLCLSEWEEPKGSCLPGEGEPAAAVLGEALGEALGEVV